MTGPAPEPAGEPYNAAQDLLGRNGVPGRRERPYLRTRARAISYDEVIARADGVAAAFGELGLQRGDRVLLFMVDRPELVIAFWGAVKVGVVPVPVAPVWPVDDVRFMLADSGARAIVCDEVTARLVRLLDLGATVPIVIGAAELPGALRWAERCAPGVAVAAAPTASDEIAFWVYTSGTTGAPKAVMHRHRSLRAAPRGLATQVIRLDPEDRILPTVGMSFGYGLESAIYMPPAFGASVVIGDGPPRPELLRRMVDHHAPTVLCSNAGFLAAYAATADAGLPSVRMAFSAGSRLPETFFEAFRARFGLPLLDGFGCTESMRVTVNRPDDAIAGSAGRPLDGYAIQIRDAAGAELVEGQSGELWVTGPTLFAGYWRRDELTDKKRDGAWLRTGDHGHLRDGRFFHEGRLDDLMRISGVWVAPDEIEQVLSAHADVSGAAVTMGGEGARTLTACIESSRTDERLHEELREACAARLPPFKVPRAFRTLAQLPRTATGKVRRRDLRGLA